MYASPTRVPRGYVVKQFRLIFGFSNLRLVAVVMILAQTSQKRTKARRKCPHRGLTNIRAIPAIPKGQERNTSAKAMP